MHKESELQKILSDKYPQKITKNQLIRDCHISKYTAQYLLQSKAIPSTLGRINNKKCYLIDKKDVIFYLLDRNMNPERYIIPTGWFAKNADREKLLKLSFKKESGIEYANYVRMVGEQREHFADYLRKQMCRLKEVLTIQEVSDYTGYSKTSLQRWCHESYMKHFYIRKSFKIPKEYLVEFLASDYAFSIKRKTEYHIGIIYDYCYNYSKRSPEAELILVPLPDESKHNLKKKKKQEE